MLNKAKEIVIAFSPVSREIGLNTPAPANLDDGGIYMSAAAAATRRCTDRHAVKAVNTHSKVSVNRLLSACSGQ